MIWTFRPWSARSELLLVVARHAQRGARLDHVADDAQRVEDARPAVDQVADEDRLASVRVAIDGTGVQPGALASLDDLVPERREQRLQLVGAAVDVADDVERAVDVLLVVPERLARRSRRRSTSSGLSTQTWRKPSRPSPLIERLRSSRWRRRTCGPNWRSGRSRLRSSQIRSGMSSTIATGSTWYRRASATSGLRASWLDVRRVDDRQPPGAPAACRRRSAACRRRRRSPTGRSRRRTRGRGSSPTT